MKKYRVILPHSWTERPGGGTINGQPGEMAVISDEVFDAAPPGTFALLPGEEGFEPPAPPVEAAKGMDVEWAGIDDEREWTPTLKRITKAEAFAPKLKRETDPFDHDRNGKPGGSLPKAKRGKRR